MYQIEYGMPSLIELPDIETHAELCVSLGLSFIELNMNFPIFQIPSMDIRQYRRIMGSHGLYFTLHVDENADVCNFNKLAARAWTDTILQSIILARQLEIPIINMHWPDGVYVTLPNQRIYLYEKFRDDFLFRLQNFRSLCEQAIGDDSVYICIENDTPARPFKWEAIDLLLESQRFGLTYDIGHDYVNGGDSETYFTARANRLRHMHIHDATPQRNHLILGAGEIDLPTRLQTAQTCGCRCVVETKTSQALTESTAYLRKAGYLYR